ncbi:meiotic nuclear division protein 1 [Melampsora americana]|nr:meiotic nuclear division protein 1 [Melampsora americana]
MSKRTGVSAEEKLTRMIDFFHASNDFFSIKDLLKLVPRATGIVSQSVEDTLKNLVDDGLVKLEKVGSINLYWSFTSEQSVTINQAIQKQNEEIEKLNSSKSELEHSIKLEKVDRVESVEREVGLQDLLELQTCIKSLQEEIERLHATDPVRIEEKEKECQLFKAGAENWTENLSILAKHCRNQFMMEEVTFCREFGLEIGFEDSI